MKRREFITLLGGVAVSPLLRPPVAQAQQSNSMRRVAVIMGFPEGDPTDKAMCWRCDRSSKVWVG